MPRRSALPQSLSLSLTFAAFVALLLLFNAYIARRVIRYSSMQRAGRILLGSILFGSIPLIFLGRLLDDRGIRPLGAWLGASALVIQVAVLLATALQFALDLLRMGSKLSRKVLREASAREEASSALETPVEPEPAAEPEPAELWQRREFLWKSAYGAAWGVGATSALYGALIGRWECEIVEQVIALEKLPPTLDGLSVVQLSDVHFGAFIGDAHIRLAAEHVAQTKPDLVVLTGDLVDHDASYAPLAGRLVRKLVPLARYGVVAIVGNHEYYAGLDEVLHILKRAGAQVLFNTHTKIGDGGGRLVLAGVDDLWARRLRAGGGPQLDEALRGSDPDRARVLLCHNPAFFPEAAASVDLQLSGHTHGSQVNFGLRPADLVLPEGYVKGLYRRGGSLLYVNRGFGTTGPPIRLGSPPEVSRIVLVRG